MWISGASGAKKCSKLGITRENNSLSAVAVSQIAKRLAQDEEQNIDKW